MLVRFTTSRHNRLCAICGMRREHTGNDVSYLDVYCKFCNLATAHLKRYGGLVTVKHIESKAGFSSGTEAPTSSAEQFPFLHPI
jgi:hypothetical protein